MEGVHTTHGAILRHDTLLGASRPIEFDGNGESSVSRNALVRERFTSAGVKVTAAGTYRWSREFDRKQNGKPVTERMSINPLSVGGKPATNPVSASENGVTGWSNLVIIGPVK